jgi:hypothetical protein
MGLGSFLGSVFTTTASIVGDVFEAGTDLISDGANFLLGGYANGSFESDGILGTLANAAIDIGSGVKDFLVGSGDSYGSSALSREDLKLPMSPNLIEGIDGAAKKPNILSQAAGWAEKHPILTQAALAGIGNVAAGKREDEINKERHERDLELIDARARAIQQARGYSGAFYGVPGAGGGDPIDRRETGVNADLIAAASATPSLRDAREAATVIRPTVSR